MAPRSETLILGIVLSLLYVARKTKMTRCRSVVCAEDGVSMDVEIKVKLKSSLFYVFAIQAMQGPGLFSWGGSLIILATLWQTQ